GLIGAAFGLGMVIGPALGAGLTLVSPRAPEFFAAGLCLVNFGLAAASLPESLPEGQRRHRRFRHPLSPESLRVAAAPPGAPVLAWVRSTGAPAGRLVPVVLVATGQGLAGPPLSSLVSQTAAGESYGEVLGVSQSLSAAARALGPTGGGLIFERLGAPAAYV